MHTEHTQGKKKNKKMQWLHQTIGWFWLAKEQSFLGFVFSSPPAVVFYAVFSHPAKELTWHHAVKQGSTMHAFPYQGIHKIPKKWKAHLPTWISRSLGDFSLLSTSQGFYRGLHLYFLSPRPVRGCADKDFLCIDFSVAAHRHQVPNVNIPLQAHVL